MQDNGLDLVPRLELFGLYIEIYSLCEVIMKLYPIPMLLLLLVLMTTSAWALQANQKRLMIEKKSKKCFYTESVRKSKKFGWLNEKKAQQISNVKRKPVFTASSSVHVRRVFVPKAWCQGS